MMPEQEDLLLQARDSVAAAKILHAGGHHGFAASRAYYAMFYVAEAFLLGKGLAFSKHSGVYAAFDGSFSLFAAAEFRQIHIHDNPAAASPLDAVFRRAGN
jgi:uncharacterized protein (UPF0332 family)